MSISQDPERDCPKCPGRMYLDDFSVPGKEGWVCMKCKHEIGITSKYKIDRDDVSGILFLIGCILIGICLPFALFFLGQSPQ